MIRTGVRRFGSTARRAAESIVEMEKSQMHGIEVSRTQGVAHDGLISGIYFPHH